MKIQAEFESQDFVSVNSPMHASDIDSISLERFREDVSLNLFSIEQFYQRQMERAVKPHRLQFNAIIYIASGKGEHYIDYKKYKLKPGTLLFLSRYQVHQFCYNPDITGYVLSFDDEPLFFGHDDTLKDLISTALSEVNTLQDADLSLLSMFQALQDEFVSHGQLFSGEISRTILRTIILKTVVREYQSMKDKRTCSARANTYYQLKSLIESNFHISRNVNDYAASLRKSCKQINKVAKENTGHTVKELLDNRLLVELKRLLAFSHYTITDISVKMGFNEATNMTKFFRRHTQLSPKAFRAVCRQNEINT
ncbi:helix-turn-helix domain-containing protein [Endozoicomonas ascidiicola]|uniref:helix-turn-helix domain-containing protein n=1 Tax=Endozoicomonas ascidiicola TaxID=1698521 RepID=UPI000AC598B1|nr:helix-turn-helix domain-containing protein [Endozoicomonas ascidiicola]